MPSACRLPRGDPEDVGVPSSAVVSFLDALRAGGQEYHSFMLVRRGAVIAESWWKPYAPDLPHALYSLSKSFVSSAIGLAVAEGRLSVDDPVLGFFPGEAPARPSANLAAMRVRHLLSMSTGHPAEALDVGGTPRSRTWAKLVLSRKVERPPGTQFVYNNGASYLLSAIVQKLTGERLLSYLTPRLLEPLGIEGATWEACPRGVDAGGWGLSLRTEDIATFGLLYLQRGVWEGQRLLPEAWVEEATRGHISNGDAPESDWQQGYGYQFWRCRHGCYMGAGAIGQLCVVMPEREAVLAMTAAAPDMQATLDVIWGTLLPAMDAPGGAARGRRSTLRRTLRGLALEPPAFRDDPVAAGAIDGATFDLQAGGQLRSISFTFARGRLVVRVRGRRINTFRCGAGRWAAGRARREGSRERLSRPVRCAYRWTEDGALEITVRWITAPFCDTYTCRFEARDVEVRFAANVAMVPTDSPPVRGSRR